MGVFTRVSVEDRMEVSMAVFMEALRGLRLGVDLRRVEWERRLEEGMDICDGRDWNGYEMGMIHGLAWCLLHRQRRFTTSGFGIELMIQFDNEIVDTKILGRKASGFQKTNDELCSIG